MGREKWDTVKIIRRVLEEKSAIFTCQIDALIQVRGIGFALDLLVKAVKVEMNGGMMTTDGSRRRTRGGTYLKMAKDKLRPEQSLEFKRLTKVKMKAQQEWVRATREARNNQKSAVESALERGILEDSEIVDVIPPPAPEVVVQQPEPPKQKNGQAKKPAPNKKHDFAASRQARFQTEPMPADPLDDLPPAVKAKFQQLQGAAHVLRERVEQLEAKPVEQQVGLEMARKLLANNEGQIAALLAQYERDSEVAS